MGAPSLRSIPPPRCAYLLVALGVLGLLLVGSAPAALAGGGYVGTETCLECHDDMAESFAQTAHARAVMPDWAPAEGCEGCHGPGGKHAEDGEAEYMFSFTDSEPEEAAKKCLSCHTAGAGMYWRGSAHENQDLRCNDCHAVHSSWANEAALKGGADLRITGTEWTTAVATVKMQITESCLSCHTGLRKTLFQRSNHPLDNGTMDCTDCHNPHGSPVEGSVAALSVNEKCYECHAETRGPFLWAHIPVREDCGGCHSPHGSNYGALLKFNPPRLCQSCHLFGHHQTVPGSSGQVWNVNNSCVNCHPRIHGSNHPSGVLFMR